MPHWLVETVEHTVSVALPVVCPVIITESPLAKALTTEELVLLVMETLPLEGEAITVALLGLFKETLVWLKVSVPEIQLRMYSCPAESEPSATAIRRLSHTNKPGYCYHQSYSLG